MKTLTLAVTTLSLAISLASAQTVYNDTNQDNSWGNAGNWSLGVPTTSSNVQIGVSPAGDLLGIDVGGAVTIASLTINSGVATGFQFVPLLDETLQVNGAITNLSSSTVNFGLPVNAGANATWDGPLLFSNTVNVDARRITLSADPISISSGNNLNFSITNLSTFGGFTGNIGVTGVTINIFSAFAFSEGNTFDFTSGTFTGATLGFLPTLSNGLAWNTGGFLTTGILTVVSSAIPEPSTWASLFGVSALGFTACRRRRQVKQA